MNYSPLDGHMKEEDYLYKQLFGHNIRKLPFNYLGYLFTIESLQIKSEGALRTCLKRN